MIPQNRGRSAISSRLLRAAFVLTLPLVVAGCTTGYSLRDRISALSVHEPEAVPRPERRTRPQTKRATDRAVEPDSVASRISRWRAVPADHKRTPYVNSPEWLKEQAEAAKKDRELDQTIRSICRGC
jgi:hypothetical protein